MNPNNHVWRIVTNPFESCPDLYKVTEEHMDNAWKKLEYRDEFQNLRNVYVGWDNLGDIYEKIGFIINLEKESGVNIPDNVAEWFVQNGFSIFQPYFRDKKLNDLL
jgi:hypothetical protein